MEHASDPEARRATGAGVDRRAVSGRPGSPTTGASGRVAWWASWITVLALSSAGAVGSLRLAQPYALDEVGTALLLFVVAPAVVLLVIGCIRQPVGVIAALLIPVGWLYVAARPTASWLLWCAPLASGALIIGVTRFGQQRALPRAAPVAALILLLATFLWPSPAPPREGTRLILIGVDGVGWPKVASLSDQNRLPKITTLMDEGRRARLCSQTAMSSVQAWVSLATGVAPSVHGVQDSAVRQTDCSFERIWDRLNRGGHAVGTCGWYCTWPPSDDLGPHGFMLPSLDAPDARAFPAEYNFLHRLARGPRQQQYDSPATFDLVLAAFRHGARISTLRRACLGPERVLAEDALVRSDGGERAAWASRLQADVFAELVRVNRPAFATIFFDQAAGVRRHAWGEVPSGSTPDRGTHVEASLVEVDRSIGLIRQVVPSDVELLFAALPGYGPAGTETGQVGPSSNGIFLQLGPSTAGVATPDSADILDVARIVGDLFGLPEPGQGPEYTPPALRSED